MNQGAAQLDPAAQTPRAGYSVHRTSWWLAVCACAIIVILMTIWPTDVPWGGDDVVLVNHALQANREHHLSPTGLRGSFSYPYGPIPLQVYQGLLLLTHDLPMLVRLHVALFAAGTAAALLWLTRTLRWSHWLAPMTLLSPFFWFYARLLWDNPFAIPVGAMLIAAYVAFLERQSRTALAIALSCVVALPFIHPMTLPLAMAVAAHALWRCRPALRRHWVILLIVAACAAFSCGNYCVAVAHQFAHSHAVPKSAYQGDQTPLSRPASFAFPLLGGRLLSAYYFFDGRGVDPGPETTIAARAARGVSIVAYPLVWLGIAAGITRFRAGWRAGAAPHNAIAAISVLTLALQCCLDGALKIVPWPHYFTGTWIACVAFLWLGLDQLGRLRWRRMPLNIPIGLVYSLATAIATAAFIIGVHRAGGGKAWYGPTLGGQLDRPSMILK